MGKLVVLRIRVIFDRIQIRPLEQTQCVKFSGEKIG
jgi:hypothetical protein